MDGWQWHKAETQEGEGDDVMLRRRSGRPGIGLHKEEESRDLSIDRELVAVKNPNASVRFLHPQLPQILHRKRGEG